MEIRTPERFLVNDYTVSDYNFCVGVSRSDTVGRRTCAACYGLLPRTRWLLASGARRSPLIGRRSWRSWCATPSWRCTICTTSPNDVTRTRRRRRPPRIRTHSETHRHVFLTFFLLFFFSYCFGESLFTRKVVYNKSAHLKAKSWLG